MVEQEGLCKNCRQLVMGDIVESDSGAWLVCPRCGHTIKYLGASRADVPDGRSG